MPSVRMSSELLSSHRPSQDLLKTSWPTFMQTERALEIVDKDCDISALEAPTFTTLDRGPPAPMLLLAWNHPVKLIGEKVLSPRIHTCDSCDKPILIYGRMIPCKHVFCLWCAKTEDRVCARCGERVIRVEQTGLGTVFMCIFAINDALCKRTYLSQRDLQAHIDHRHTKSSNKEEVKEERAPHRDPRADSRAEPRIVIPVRNDPRPAIATASNDPRVGNKDIYDSRDAFLSGAQFARAFNPSQPPPTTTLQMSTNISHHIPVMTSSRTNLITVPLQDAGEQPTYSPSRPPPQTHPLSHATHVASHSLHNPLSHPPPSHQFTSPPPISQPPPYSTSVTSSYNQPYSSQQSPQYTYPPSGGPPQGPILPPPYPSTLPPGPVPPPSFGSNNRPPYDGQYRGGHWNAPPPQQQGLPPHPSHPITHPPPGSQRLHHQPNNQTVTEAYVTLATNDRYAIGALVLAHSLRNVKTTREVCILITPSVSEDLRTQLYKVFNNVVCVDVLDSNDSAHLALLKRPELGVTFTKLHCWTLTQYTRCVFLDADMLAVQNSDELFGHPELSAACDIGWPDCFNSGLFVFSPSQDTYNRLLQLAETTGSFDGGDQGLLNTYFNNWNRLSFVYNMVASVTYTYLPAYKQFGKDVKFVHFLGETKPWQQKFNYQSGTVVTQHGQEHFSSHLTTWWRIYVTSVHHTLPQTVTSTPDEESPNVPEYQQHSQDNHHTPPYTHDTRNTYHTNYFESKVITTHQEMPSQCFSQPCLEANFQDKATQASFECSFCDRDVPISVSIPPSYAEVHAQPMFDASADGHTDPIIGHQQTPPASPPHESITVSETFDLSSIIIPTVETNIHEESKHVAAIPSIASLNPPTQSLHNIPVAEVPTIVHPVNLVVDKSIAPTSTTLTTAKKITRTRSNPKVTPSPALPISSPSPMVPELRHPTETKPELGMAGRRGIFPPSRFGTPFQPFQPLVCTRIRSPFSGQWTAEADPAHGPSLELSQQLTGLSLDPSSLIESKKRWEEGSPDYLGRDSFDNILAHIDSKINEGN